MEIVKPVDNRGNAADHKAEVSSKPSVVLSVILIVCGLFAIGLPIITSLGVAIVIGWLALITGFIQVLHAFKSQGVGHILWKLIVAVFYLLAGLYLLAHPALGVLGFALALGILFCAEGVTDMITYIATPKTERSGWVLLDGLITLTLGLIIGARWPLQSFWMIGTFAGISMLMSGITRLMMALAVRKLAKHRGDDPIQQNQAA